MARRASRAAIWQSVRLVATGETLVKDVFIEPKIADDSATFHLELENTSSQRQSVQLVTTIRSAKDPDRIVAQSIRSRISSTRREQAYDRRSRSPMPSIGLRKTRTCTRPRSRSTGSDRWTSRFGMREFTIRDKQFYSERQAHLSESDLLRGLVPERDRLSRQPRDGRARDSVGQGRRLQHDSTLAATAGADVVGPGG